MASAQGLSAPARVAKKSYVYLVLANLFWAGNYVFAPVVLTEFTPLQMVYVRWGLAVVPLLVLAHIIEKPDWKAALREWPQHVIQSLLGVVGYTLLLYQGLLSINPLDASLLGAINPAIIIVLATLVVRERPGGRLIAGAGISIVGAIIVITRGNPADLAVHGLSVGDLWIIGSVLAWAFYSVNARRVKTPPVTATALQAVVGVILLTPVTFAAGPILPAVVSTEATWSLIYVVIFPTVLGFILWNLGVAEVGASRSGIFLNLIVAFTAIIGLFLGEPITVIQVLGGVIVFAGVYLSTVKGRKRARP